MVEIYRTDVTSIDTAEQVLMLLQSTFPDAGINFDLGDCDRILRIEAKTIANADVVSAMHRLGHHCEPLP